MTPHPFLKTKLARLLALVLGATLLVGGIGIVSSSCASAADNLIANSSLEVGKSKPDSWLSDSWGDNDALFTYPAEGYNSSRAAKVAITRYKNGDAKWYFKDIPVTAGQDYIYSEYFRASSTTQLVARYTLQDRTYKYVRLEDFVPSQNWKAYSRVLTVPEKGSSVTVFHVLNTIGSLVVDEYALSPSNPGLDATSFDAGYVSLSFDDGWITQYTEALPILNKAELKGSFYIVTEKITNEASTKVAVAPDVLGGSRVADPTTSIPFYKLGFWQRVESFLGRCEVTHNQLYMNKKQVLKVSQDGHEISAHTHTHADLGELPLADATKEIADSRFELEQLDIKPLDTFVYPYGSYSPAVMLAVRDQGFLAARSVEPGYNTTTSNKYALKVQNITSRTTPEELKAWVDTANKNKLWLILVFHQIDTSGSEYSSSPEFLQTTVNYLKETNTPVITLHEGLQKMQ